MYKLLSALLFFIVLVISVDTRAADNLSLKSYDSYSKIPSAFSILGGGAVLETATYKDDDGKTRTDKTFYTASHSYKSTYKPKDISKILNPALGSLGSLFKETTVKKSKRAGAFDVMMTISTPFKDFDCASVLSYKNSVAGAKEVFVYSFSSFNMVFTSMTIKIEMEEVGSSTNIKLTQIAAVKGSTITKLNNYWALGQFEKSLKANLQKLKSGVGGY